jgi:hypothetical protein
MPAFNAIGMNALGLTANNMQLAATTSSSASLTATLTTAIKLAANVAATTTLTVTLTTLQGNLSAGLSSTALFTASLTTSSAPLFTPSVARTIYVQATSPVFTGSKWWNLTDNKKPRGLKDPDATIDITFNWSDWLNDIGEAAISDVTFTLNNGLNNVSTFNDSTKATVFVSGGLLGTSASIACKIKTNTTPSRTDERTVYLDIGDE